MATRRLVGAANDIGRLELAYMRQIENTKSFRLCRQVDFAFRFSDLFHITDKAERRCVAV